MAERPAASPFLPVLTSGLIIGVVEVTLASSFAALIFSGKLSGSLSAGLGLALFSAVVAMVLMAVFSSQPGIIGSAQAIAAAVLALSAGSVASRVGAGAGLFGTVVIVLGLTTLTTGGFLLALGAFRLGELIRFIPYPVVGGFLAGTGWLLVKGGLGVATGQPFTLHNLGSFFHGGSAGKWATGLAFAAVLVLASRSSRHGLVIPGLLAAAIAAFYVIAPIAAGGMGPLKAHGWLLGDLPRSVLWRPWTVTRFGDADWSAVLSQVPNMATVAALSALTLLLNASGIELALGHDLDLNRELVVAGAANTLGGLGGGIVGFQSLSLTHLVGRVGAINRWVGLIAGAVCVVALVFGAATLSLFPRPILGGVIVFLGLGLLTEWLYNAWFKLPRPDYAVVTLILLVIATFGFLPGVGVGLAAALLLFVVDYSRTDVVKHSLSGADYPSRTDRSPQQRDALREHRDEIWILELQGFVFFGTANRLLEQIRQRVNARNVRPLRFLVLDFRRVIGVDSSAMLSFAKVLSLAEKKEFRVLFSAAPEGTRSQLERVVAPETEGLVSYVADLDRAVEWCEDRILSRSSLGERGPGDSIWVYILAGIGPLHADRLMSYLRRLEFKEGDVLIHEGEASRDIYLLESGRVTVSLMTPAGEAVRLRTMGQGTVVGEMASYLGTTRTASVIAETPVIAYRLSQEAFDEMEEQEPQLAAAIHRMFASLIAQRLADTLDALRALSS